MKKINLMIFGVLLVAAANAQTWKLDKAHSNLGFSISHLVVSDVDGAFQSFDIKVTSAKPDFTDAKIELTADVKSIDTDNEKRDDHLRSSDFFDVEKYPELTFVSQSFTKGAGNRYALKGNLTMHGVTKPVNLDVEFRGITPMPNTKAKVAGFKLTGVIKRSDFGLSPSTPAAMLGEEVSIKANIALMQE